MRALCVAATLLSCALLARTAAFAAQPSAALRLAPATAEAGDLFGSAVALDGTTLLVGAPGAHDFAGGAYVFAREPSGWSELARLTLPDALPGDQLGAAVALSGSSALLASARPGARAGLFAFVRDADGSWLPQASWSLPQADVPQALALAGATAVVGGRQAAYVYVQVAAGSWRLQARLQPDPADAHSSGFGAAVAIAGAQILVGAPSADHFEGAAYVFTRSPSGQWLRQARLTADAREFALFGSAVALADGYALVGAYGESNFQGAAYLLRDSGHGWMQQARLQSDDAVRAYQCFGRSVALAAGAAIVGSPCTDPDETAEVAVYQYFPGALQSWNERVRLGPAPAAARENFASALATSGELTVMGSPEDGAAGAVYVAQCDDCRAH